MKKRVLNILLCLCMVLMLCPVSAFAEEPTGSLTITVDGFKVGKTRFFILLVLSFSRAVCRGALLLHSHPHSSGGSRPSGEKS